MLKLSDQIGYGAASVTAALTSAQVEGVLKWISLGITILIGVSTLVLNLIKAYKASVKDKVITKEEATTMINQSKEDINFIKEQLAHLENYIK